MAELKRTQKCWFNPELTALSLQRFWGRISLRTGRSVTALIYLMTHSLVRAEPWLPVGLGEESHENEISCSLKENTSPCCFVKLTQGGPEGMVMP